MKTGENYTNRSPIAQAIIADLAEIIGEHKPPVSGNDDRNSDEKPIDVEG
jgi:hypothetical protein